MAAKVVVAIVIAAIAGVAVVVRVVTAISTATTITSAITFPLVSLQKQWTSHEMNFLTSCGARM